MKVYVAGPMTGYPEFNYPAFHAARDEWEGLGHQVLCPTDNTPRDRYGNFITTHPYAFYLKRDIKMLLEANAVALLPGWQESKGASLEARIAVTLGFPTYDAVTKEEIQIRF